MRTKAGIAGRIVAGLLSLVPVAYSSPYSSMAVPGTHNDWNTTPIMVLIGGAGNVWVCTQTLSSASGEFKFAANGNWTVNWGGNASLSRVPAVATAITPTDTNLKYAGFSNGDYRITFNDSTREFRIEWAGASPLPPPAIGTLSLVGNFNGWNSAANPMTNHPAPSTNLWSGLVDLEFDTTFQFYPDGTWSNQFGAPEATTVNVSGLGIPVTNSVCGKSDFTLTGFAPGTFQFVLDATNATATIVQITNRPALSSISVQGNFIGTTNLPGNMTRVGSTTWESEHYVTNIGSVTVRFTADNNTRIWGATNATPIALPASGILATGLTAYANISGVTNGRYRITFDHQTGSYTFRQVYSEATGINLISNPGFESTTNGNASDWISWQSWTKTPADGVPPHSGQQSGALHAKVNEWDTDYASYSQDVNIQSDQTYRASAWIRVTPDWTATTMQIKMEWRNSTNEPLGSDAIATFTPDTSWNYFSVEGTPPDGATKIHLVILCMGAGTTGYMCVDDVELMQVPPREQNFDTWGQYASMGPIDAPDGWSASSGKVNYNVPPGRPPAEVFISQYVEGIGNNKAIEIYNGTLSNLDLAAGNYVLQQYNNGTTTPSVSISLSGELQPGTCLVVARPGFPTNYAPDEAITDVPLLLTNKNLTFNGDDVVVLLRGSTVLDRVGQVGANAVGATWNLYARNRTLTRKQTLFTGTVSAVTAVFPQDDWIVSPSDTFDDLGSHTISYIDPNEPYTPAGYSLLLNTNAWLLSGEVSGGIGDASFWYRTESAAPPIDLAIETAVSKDGPWTTNETLVGLASTNFRYAVVSVNSQSARFARFAHTGSGANRFRLDEIVLSPYSSNPRLETFAAWTLPAYVYPGTYSQLGWTIEDASISTNGGSRAALIAPPNSAVVSPAYEDGVGEVLFWASPAESNSPAYLAILSTIDNGATWITQKTFAVSSPSNHSAWLYLTNSPSQIRIVFDSSKSSGDALVDDIEVRLPVIYRNQDFNSWPTKPSYTSGTDTYQGWIVNNCMVDAQASIDGNSARLSTSYTDAWIRSPYLPDGIGSISFQLNKTTTVNPAIAVEVSSNESTWTPIAVVTSTVSGYTLHSFFYSNTSNYYVRFRHAAGNAITPVENISIGVPQPRPSVSIFTTTDPTAPAIDNAPYLVADVVALNGASVVSVTGYYRIASAGWNTLPMAAIEYGSYASTTAIPAQTGGVQVSYYVKVQYAGIGAAPGSTGFSTNISPSATNSYFVSSIPKGKVWINEISYYSTSFDPNDGWDYYENHEFIELCGVAGTAVSNWTIELAFGADADVAKNGGTNVYASYAFTNTFANTTNGFGFYVLGDNGLTNIYGGPINKELTVLVPSNVAPYLLNNHIHNSRGVIRLLDEYRHLIYAISYAGSASGALPSGTQSGTSSNSVSLRNTGSTYEDFTWGSAVLSIGGVNGGQTLVPVITNALAAVFHVPGHFIDSAAISNFMRSPEAAAHSDPVQICYGFAAAAGYGQPGGIIHYRDNDGIWRTASMAFKEGSQDSADDVYSVGIVPAYTNARGSTLEYVIEAQIVKAGIDTTYIGAGAPAYELFDTLDAAKASPFQYTFAVPSIAAEAFYRSGSNWIIVTIGNDPEDPYQAFKVYSSTNMLLPLNQWKTNSFTTSTDYLGQITFTIPLAATNRNNFYRFDPIW